ncbi:MAG: glycoside hydrolase family 97 protein [Salinibacter sp.]|uniref:glycoside hydrolase family 97 protein n=1 Tax=Salinibacter sp. TaxID=2065818 RepID=UPI0035D4F078
MTPSAPTDDSMTATSPDGTIAISVELIDGQPHYTVVADGDTLVAPSPLGFELQNAPPLRDGFDVVGTSRRTVNTTWTPVWGTQDTVRNHFVERTVRLQEAEMPERRLDLVLRAYDDGVAFRYRWPEQPNLDSLRITSEETHFRLTADHTAWWIPDDYDNYEWIYRETPLSAIRDSAAEISHNSFLEDGPEESSKSARPGAVNTPLTLRSPGEDRYLALHEAALTDYAGMTLQADADTPTTLHANLVPWPDGVKVKASVPHRTPWRVIQIADRPGRLIESHLLQNLNEPSKIENPSWVEPMTYIGIWWGMHIGKYSWGQSGVHGATTERTKRYMDFAAEHDIDGVLVEGWNLGWESWLDGDKFDFTESYPDFDLQEVTEYGKKKGVVLIGHHETGGDVPAYERQLDEALALYDSVGVPAIKTGYAGPIRPKGIHHHGQQMVNHYRRVVKKAAEHEIMLNVHEPIKPTGIRRTWPNMMTREGVRGMEYNAWSSGNPPAHTVTLPFTRMLAGPLDYTPGIFNLTPEEIMPDHRVRTTLSKQLANMVVLYSPVQMAADLVEHYKGHDAVEFIERVPADWSESRVLQARIGEYITTARRKNGGATWFVGTTTNTEARTLTVPLGFLDSGQTYVAHVFEDTPKSDYEDNPHAYRIRRGLVTASDTIAADLARSGGQAVILEPSTGAERNQYEALE